VTRIQNTNTLRGGIVLKSINRMYLLGAVLLLLLLLPVLIIAGTTGKIAGVVVDADSDNPIPGATVRIIGTDIATQTDVDGEYFIINLPAGTYTVTISSMGYQTIEKENVRVLLDLTTPVDFEIGQVNMPLDRQVKVYAERPAIQKDMTATRSIMTADRLSFMPNTITVQGIIANMAGTVVDHNNDLHVRGGRSGTVTYFYDGYSVQDPFAGEAGIRIMPDALEEINLTSGGFPAEYGEALSGIVNAVTKTGTGDYHGKLKFYDGASSKYDVNTGEFGSLERIDNNAVSYNLSGPVPFNLGFKSTFFIAGEYLRNGGYLPHNEQERYTQSGKFSFQPSPNMNLTATGSYYTGESQVYDHIDGNGYSYDFNLDGLGISKTESYLYGLKGHYNISEKTILGFSYNHFFTKSKRAPEHLFDTYWDQWPGYSVDSNGIYNGTIDDDNYQADDSLYYYTGYTAGDDFVPIYHRRSTEYNAFLLNYTSQINKFNQIRAGAEYRGYEITWDEKQFFNSSPYGEKYDQTPIYASIYAQDKLELKDFIINAGIRWDYFHSEVDYYPNIYDTTTTTAKSKSKSQISPRLGVSHPISENSVIRFNYGYFFQVPNYIYMYTNLDANLSSGLPLVGNPDLEAEKTIAYELGLNHMINQDVRLDVTVYYKDIENLIATRVAVDPDNAGSITSPVTQFVNEDYGSVKGVDITLEKVARGNLFGSLVYSYMIAKGNSSSAYDGYYSYIANTTDTVLPVNEYPLSFDQRHSAHMNVNYRTPRGWQGSLFGIPLPDAWGLSVDAHYGSGLPYTLTDDNGIRLGALNGARMPATYSVDMRFNKDIYFSRKNTFFSFFIEVTNLFDRRNIVNVYTNTGEPDVNNIRYSSGVDPDGEGPLTAAIVDDYYKLIAKDPQNYTAPRTVRLGLEFNF